MNLLFFGMVVVFLISCQVEKEAAEKAVSTGEQPLSQEEADVADSIDDLDELDQMNKELDEDLGFDELENLDLK